MVGEVGSEGLWEELLCVGGGGEDNLEGEHWLVDHLTSGVVVCKFHKADSLWVVSCFSKMLFCIITNKWNDVGEIIREEVPVLLVPWSGNNISRRNTISQQFNTNVWTKVASSRFGDITRCTNGEPDKGSFRANLQEASVWAVWVSLE